MVIEIIMNGSRKDLKELPLYYGVTIYTGTFDPAHKGHVEVAENVRNYKRDRLRNLVLFYPHSHSTRKNPIPLDARIEILRDLIKTNFDLGILSLGETPESGQWVGSLFTKLYEYHSLQYSRVISGERLEKVISDGLEIVHFVSPLKSIEADLLPPNYILLPTCPRKMSSTELRTGKFPFGPEYSRVRHIVKTHYPLSRFCD